MDTHSRSLTVKRRFDAPAERVFDAWLDPETARQWLFTTDASTVVRADNDPRVGGDFVFVDRREDGEIEHVGRYLEIVRPHRLVFRFAVPALSPEYDIVVVDIVPLDQGCELTLTTWMTPEIHAEWGDATREGWTTMLETLAAGLAESPDPARTW